MKKNVNNNSSKIKTIVSSEIKSDAIINYGKVNFDFSIEINPSGTIIPKAHLEIGEDTLHINKEGFEELRDYFTEEHARNKEMYEQFKKDLMKGIQVIPEILELGRREVDKMDEWDVHRAKKRGMAYISQEELDQLIEELNELRGAKQKPEEEEEFEKVR